MIVILCLIVLAAGQQCPYCEWNACAITSQGLANCSACNQGALVQVISGATPTIVDDFGPNFQETIGVCMLCMTGCSTCAYGNPVFNGPPVIEIYCTSCNTGYYLIDGQFGSCTICPANCQACYDVQTQFEVYSLQCTACSSGYTLQTGGCVQDTTAALAGGQGGSEQSSASMVTVGLATWGVVMTLIAAVFFGFWAKNRNKVSSLGMLNVELAVARNSN